MKQIIVNVSGLSIGEKQRVNEALAKITGVQKLPVINPEAGRFFAPSSSGAMKVTWDIPSEPKTPTHTPQQVLEMAGMATNRKVRKDFDRTKEYSVNVSGCTEEGKKEVQQAFFDAGFPWNCGRKEYQHLDAVQYSNTTKEGIVTAFFMYGTTTKECNMDPEEFFSYVYEPVQYSNPLKSSHLGNVNMNKNYENLIKKVKTLKTNLTNAETFLHNMVHGKNLSVRGLPSPHPETKFFGKITSGIQGEYGNINLCDLQEPELALLRELISLYTRRIEDEKGEGEAKIAAIEELLS